MTTNIKFEILCSKQIRNTKSKSTGPVSGFCAIITFSLVMLVVFFSLSYAGPGSASAAFFKIPVDSRISSIGEASAAYVDNAAALYYNPAGLARIKKGDFRFMHNMWLLGMNHEYFAAGFSMGNAGNLGLSFNYWGSGAIPSITIRGDTVGEFKASDWTLGIGYGKSFSDFYMGTGVKYVSEKNESLSAGGLGFDLGLMYDAPIKGLQAGLSLTNIGTNITLDSTGFPMPMYVRAGWRYQVQSFIFAQDFIVSNSDNFGIGVGAEYWIGEILALRLGYRTGSNVDGLSGLRAGMGISVKGFGIDYAYAPYGKLGMSHRFTVSFKIQ